MKWPLKHLSLYIDLLIMIYSFDYRIVWDGTPRTLLDPPPPIHHTNLQLYPGRRT